jgi:hypothetical protein
MNNNIVLNNINANANMPELMPIPMAMLELEPIQIHHIHAIIEQENNRLG